MTFMQNSVTIVINGEWSNFYLKPNWIAEKVCEENEIEIGISGEIPDYIVSFRCNGVLISPSPTQIAFNATSTEEGCIDKLITYVNNFLSKAHTPAIYAYGFNCDFAGDDEGLLATLFDEMADNQALLEGGYSIQNLTVHKTLIKNDSQFIVTSELVGTDAHLHFNKHIEGPFESSPALSFNQEDIYSFIDDCGNIAHTIGYDIKEDI